MTLSISDQLLGVAFERPVQTGGVFSPKVVGDAPEGLVFNGLLAFEFTARAAKSSLLAEFLRLEHGSDETIRSFARKWGGLYLCEPHGLPMRHSPNCRFQLKKENQHHYTESFESWRRISQGFNALLHIAISISEGKPGSLDHWNLINSTIYSDFPGNQHAETIELFIAVPAGDPEELQMVAASLLQNSVRRLIDLAHLTLRFWWNRALRKFQIDFDTPDRRPNLFAILVLQLLPVLATPAGRNGYALCTECGRPYFPSRLPARNRNHYCDQCKRAAWRDAKRRQRRRSTLGDSLGTREEKTGKNRQKPPK